MYLLNRAEDRPHGFHEQLGEARRKMRRRTKKGSREHGIGKILPSSYGKREGEKEER